MHLFQKGPMNLYCDNKAPVYIANNPVYHERIKHIKVDCHFIRENIENKEIIMHFVHSKDQLTNTFTKSLASLNLSHICS